ncbi:SCO family protein [Flavobacterium amniphilum]|uniref:SCO family protein n=1 Tax=Flavobacterium amniphilum TaxID=1834035 RepID=UPI00202A6014|nr:SCO family protein [Flavobacterium amniphilum]MCL9804839.1 SCO family protein [Flavobacterium amniphilum]
MKNKSYIGLSLVILVFGIIFIPKIVSRIKNNDVVKGDRLNRIEADGSVKSDLHTIGKAPQFSLTNQKGQTITNESYKGKVYVLEFFFSTCPTICPIMNKNMKFVQESFASNANFGIASITINPETDTPEALKKHAEDIGAVGMNWNFLTGDQKKIYEIAQKGFNMYVGQNKKVAGGFEHSGLFALIDKEGNIRCRKDNFGNPIVYYDGLQEEGIKQIKQDISKLLAE